MAWGTEVGIVLVAMFIVYLIAANRLGVYLGLMGFSQPSTAAAA